jgi:hypothetical protein
MATNPTVVNGSDRADAGDWSELERGFFESAPPEVAVPPPAPPRFDDLEPVARVERRARRRSTSRGRSRSAGLVAPADRKARERLRALATLAQDLYHRIGRRLAARAAAARPAARAIWASALERATTGSRRLGPALRAMRVAGARRARTFAERTFVQLFVDLPAERPDGKTTLAAAVALIVVCGLSASVLGHVRLTPPPAPDAVVQPLAPR